jgi:mRNA interferase RelE/StbE
LTSAWRYEIASTARRDLRKLDPPIRVRVLSALDRYVQDPALGDVRKMAGSEHFRLRVGDWRVRFARMTRRAPSWCYVYCREAAPTIAEPSVRSPSARLSQNWHVLETLPARSSLVS